MISIDELKRLCRVGENCEVEFKDGREGFPGKELWKSYSAFANTNGGLIVIGVVEEKGKGHTRFLSEGLEKSKFETWKKNFWDDANNSSKVNLSLLSENDVLEVPVSEDRWVLAFRVPRADYRVRPIYINDNIQTGTYKRRHEGDYRCPIEEIKAMIRDANMDGNDGLHLEHYGMEDIDLPTLHAYRQLFQNRNVDHALNELNDKEFLRCVGGYYTDRETGTEGLTMAGLLMFGKGLPIRERFPMIRMDYIDKTNLQDEDMRYSDRITYDMNWENNLYQFVKRVLPRLTSDLKVPFVLENGIRTADTPMHKLIREALTNMIIHADLLMEGILRVEKREDGYFFSNPGYLKLSVEDIYRGETSKARNPKLQDMFRLMGFGDNIGTGFPTLIKTWKKEAGQAPVLTERPEVQVVELSFAGLKRKSQNDPKTDPKTGPKSGSKTDPKNLPNRQTRIVQMIKENNHISQRELARKLSVSPTTIKADLKKIEHIVVHVGPTNGGEWKFVAE